MTKGIRGSADNSSLFSKQHYFNHDGRSSSPEANEKKQIQSLEQLSPMAQMEAYHREQSRIHGRPPTSLHAAYATQAFPLYTFPTR